MRWLVNFQKKNTFLILAFLLNTSTTKHLCWRNVLEMQLNQSNYVSTNYLIIMHYLSKTNSPLLANKFSAYEDKRRLHISW